MLPGQAATGRSCSLGSREVEGSRRGQDWRWEVCVVVSCRSPCICCFQQVARMEILKIHASKLAKHGDIDYEAVVKVGLLGHGTGGKGIRLMGWTGQSICKKRVCKSVYLPGTNLAHGSR